MDGQNPVFRKVERRLVGEPAPVGERTIAPVARVTGWRMPRFDFGRENRDIPAGHAAGAWLRVTPVEAIVRERDETEHRISISDPTRESIRGLVYAAIAVAAACWLLVRLIERR